MSNIPILRIKDILIVSLQDDLTDRIAIRFQNDLLQKIYSTNIMGVLIDISVLDIVDSFLGRILSDTSKMVILLGAELVIVGMKPSVAITLVELGLQLKDRFEANLVSSIVTEIINDNTHKSVEDILNSINKGLLQTRGAVAGIIQIDTINKEFEYSAVGNIEFRYIFKGKTERLIFANGILGAYSNNMMKIHKKHYEKGSVVTMCTDGIINKWDSTSYFETNLVNPSLIANSILKDFGKDNDDATILVAVLK